MIPESCFKDNKEAGHAIYKYTDTLAMGNKLWLRPYNRYMPEATEWWLIPDKEWPAYHNGKLFIWRTPPYSSSPGLLYAGYYVEHGLDKEVGNLPSVNKKLVMTERWYWHEFLKQSKSGAVDDMARSVSMNSGFPVTIFLKAYEFNRIHEPDKESGIPFDSLEFRLDPNKEGLHAALRGSKILKQVNASRDVAEMANILDDKKEFSFFWIDVMIGVLLHYKGTNQDSEWGAEEIWHKALKPWLPFVR
ncbi:MAG TPA: hypothetical protein PLA81_03365 [Syntrophorhabdaceae bacterium]|nr:MAG: hypothetical protein BWX92_03808 [Deltaproteobacteria bacterium ADurb.Bin135]HNQ63900.1 hypothetical protein [Syntrophorhabdaceae bacterium]HOD79747.1 hypothetical protein [Syntrophorhabdus sp.]HOF57257.1 hypothetical protein [Syntrophorhabdaceae bacterium]HOS06639.1 hypothetical protein [Syntrophorhabdaceae bacterium]